MIRRLLESFGFTLRPPEQPPEPRPPEEAHEAIRAIKARENAERIMRQATELLELNGYAERRRDESR